MMSWGLKATAFLIPRAIRLFQINSLWRNIKMHERFRSTKPNASIANVGHGLIQRFILISDFKSDMFTHFLNKTARELGFLVDFLP